MSDVRLGDCLDVMAGLEAESVDTVITDPPYGLEFMGKSWDHGVPGVRYWAECLRVAKPGAMLCAFGGRRTEHRLVCAIEDAGWEIVDKLAWIYGQGFPKSYSLSKNFTKAVPSSLRCACDPHSRHTVSDSQSGCHPADGLYDGPLHQVLGSALDAAPSQAGVLGHSHADFGGGGPCSEQEHNLDRSSSDHLSIGDCVLLLEHLSRDSRSGDNTLSDTLMSKLRELVTVNRKRASRIYGTDDLASDLVSSLACASPPNNYVASIYHKCPTCQMYYAVEGYGTAIKPAIEEICLARKPMTASNCVNALGYGVAGLWVDGCRVGTNGDTSGTWGARQLSSIGYHGTDVTEFRTQKHSAGRWPANLLLSCECDAIEWCDCDE